MFELKNIKFKDILDIPYLKINEGKVTVITGPSGSGKSTLLKMLNKMQSPTSGEIYYKGENIKKINPIGHNTTKCYRVFSSPSRFRISMNSSPVIVSFS